MAGTRTVPSRFLNYIYYQLFFPLLNYLRNTCLYIFA
jgi:hypothetical protein